MTKKPPSQRQTPVKNIAAAEQWERAQAPIGAGRATDLLHLGLCLLQASIAGQIGGSPGGTPAGGCPLGSASLGCPSFGSPGSRLLSWVRPTGTHTSAKRTFSRSRENAPKPTRTPASPGCSSAGSSLGSCSLAGSRRIGNRRARGRAQSRGKPKGAAGTEQAPRRRSLRVPSRQALWPPRGNSELAART